MKRKTILKNILLVMLATWSAGCSTTKNTAGSRFYHSTLTRYNTWFNGNEAYKKGADAQQSAIKDNFLSILTLSPLDNPSALKAGASDFDRAVEKAQKSIKLHSITQKPAKKSGTMSPKEKAWYNKREYNPFLWHAWMLLGDAQMHKGEFLEAQGVYEYITQIYADEPRVAKEAEIKRAQCYSHLEWNYEADEILARLGTDSIPIQLKGEYAQTMAAHLIKQKRNEEAIPYLEDAISWGNNSKSQKIRMQFLLGQLYQQAGRNAQAYQAYRKVISMNPPYRTEFSARIQQTETMGSKQSETMLKKLGKMAKDPNNKNYQEQIYYAIGNIHLAEGDTIQAIKDYNTGAEKATGSSQEKGILLKQLAGLYWQRAEYADAQRCYSEAIGLIDKDDPDYLTIRDRSAVLDELVEYVETVQLEDSLLHLATLPEAELNSIIDKLIADYDKTLEEEAAQAAKSEKEAARDASMESLKQATPNDGSWYFYNAALVKNGMAEFNRTWGKRKLSDDWRRTNKTVVPTDSQPEESLAALGTDTIARAASDTIAVADTIVTDPHNRMFYLQQIPFSDQDKQRSHEMLADGLLGAGILYKDELQEYGLAENSLTRIVSSPNFAEFEQVPEAYYQLFLMYSLTGQNQNAARCKEELISQYPDNDHTLVISSPYFLEDAIYGVYREDSIYAETYNAYMAGNRVLAKSNLKKSQERYPTGKHRPKFLFIEAMYLLEDGDSEGFAQMLKDIVDKYPDNEISTPAGMMLGGLKSGKVLQSTGLVSIWDTRANIGELTEGADSARQEFSTDRNVPFTLAMVFPTDSVNQNQLLFEMARYNFTNFMVRNFEIGFSEMGGLSFMQIHEFLNFDEAFAYRNKLFSNPDMSQILSGMKSLVISRDNLELLLKSYSVNDYIEFQEEHLNYKTDNPYMEYNLDEIIYED